MQNREVFEFAIIRIVPRVEREEFINAGVLLFCKRKQFLGMKYYLDEERLKALCGDIDITLLTNYLEAWSSICAGAPKGGEIGKFELASRFRWLTAAKSTIIQCSKTHPGLCTDPEQTLQDNFMRYVALEAKE